MNLNIEVLCLSAASSIIVRNRRQQDTRKERMGDNSPQLGGPLGAGRKKVLTDLAAYAFKHIFGGLFLADLVGFGEAVVAAYFGVHEPRMDRLDADVFDPKCFSSIRAVSRKSRAAPLAAV